MSRARQAAIVTRKSEVAGKPSHSTELRCGEVYIFKLIQSKGSRGITCGDFRGDLRHYIRNLKHKGIGLKEAWEKDAFGQHKRWWLKEGHSIVDIPYTPKRKKTAGDEPERSSNPKNSNGEIGGLSDE